jgi:hypothetical protein
MVNTLPPNGRVRLGLLRKQSHLSVDIQCLNSADSIAVTIAAFEAATAGRFADCAARANEYASRYVQQSYIYSLGRQCSILGGLTKGEAVYTTYLTWWTLRLQELKYHPERMEETRSEYLGAQTELLGAGQPLLVDELRRQWSLATGESSPPLPATPPVAKYVPPRSVAPQFPVNVRSAGSSCESGHWIEEVTDDGDVVELEDGSLWQVDGADTVDSALWLASESIVVCDGKLINTDDHESVEAERIR